MRISDWSSDVCSSDLWVRPLHGIVAVFDGMALKGGLQMGEGRQVPFGATTHGHRFLAPAVFDVIGFADYRVKLAPAQVMLEPAERRQLTAEMSEGLATNAGVTRTDAARICDGVSG